LLNGFNLMRSGFWIIASGIFSLAAQRLVIAFIALRMAPIILGSMLPASFLNAALLTMPLPGIGAYTFTIASVLSSLFVILALDSPRLYQQAVSARKNNQGLSKMLLSSAGMLTADTISMELVGPEIALSLWLTAGVPLLGETVRFMEEFVYGANGKTGIGEAMIEDIEGLVDLSLAGISGRELGSWGWTLPQDGWEIDKSGKGVYPSAQNSLKISRPGSA